MTDHAISKWSLFGVNIDENTKKVGVLLMAILTVKPLRSLYSKIAKIKPRLIGLDVGTSLVGVALSDPTLTLALPQATLRREQC